MKTTAKQITGYVVEFGEDPKVDGGRVVLLTLKIGRTDYLSLKIVGSADCTELGGELTRAGEQLSKLEA